MRRSEHLRAAVLALAMLATPAWAGRPLASDDAGTADPGHCQLEGWVERADSDRALMLAPACGLMPGVELGADTTLPDPREPVRQAAGLALKWVPESGRFDTALGSLGLGLKFAAGYEHPAGAGWRRSGHGVLLLASLEATGSLGLHLNLGPEHDTASGATATLLNLAAVWTPAERALLFAEWQGNDRRRVFGGPARTVGARWWMDPERFGLDLTATRDGSGGPTLWSLGFGWYGVSLF